MEKTQEEIREYHRNWRKNNSDKIKSSDEKFRKSEKGKEYLKKYRELNPTKEYQKKWREENIEKSKGYNKKYQASEKGKVRWKTYYDTPKGIANMLRKHDVRRLGIKNSKLDYKTIEMVNDRDKVCVFCGCNFNGNVEYDHLNPFKQFSEKNIVKCCSSCNKDKSRADMIQWMNFKGYKISEKLKELYEKAYE